MPLRSAHSATFWFKVVCAGFVGFSIAANGALAQSQPAATLGGTILPDDEPVNVGDSPVGYIDNAIPGTQFRLRFDAAYDNKRPGRAEFFWAKAARAGGPGVKLPETTVDYQDISAYFEYAINRCTSVFGELPVRFINPEQNDNTGGLTDSTIGFKRALIYGNDEVLSFQLKVYIPTGDADRGLGNNHTTIEPGLLWYKRLNDCWNLSGELRYWVPVDGSEGFEGEVIRYGLGLGYNWYRSCDLSITPVAEFVGWTVLSGKTPITEIPPAVTIRDAAGDTILNAKLGVRVGYGDSQQVYMGFGQALTGDRWYDQTFRLEYRILF